MADNGASMTPDPAGSPEPSVDTTVTPQETADITPQEGKSLGDYMDEQEPPEGETPAEPVETPSDPEKPESTEEEDIDKILDEIEKPVDDTPKSTVDQLSKDAQDLIESLDPELAKTSPEVHKRAVEMFAGVEKVVEKAKAVGEKFSWYEKTDQALMNPEFSPQAVALLANSLADQLGIDRAEYAKALGFEPTTTVATETPTAPQSVDVDDYDLTDPYSRAEYVAAMEKDKKATIDAAVKAAIQQVQQQITPELETLKKAHETQADFVRQTQQREAIKEAVPRVQRALAAEFNGFTPTPRQVVEAQQANPALFASDSVRATEQHLVRQIAAHQATIAQLRASKRTDDMTQPDTRVGVIEKPIEERSLADYMAAADI